MGMFNPVYFTHTGDGTESPLSHLKRKKVRESCRDEEDTLLCGSLLQDASMLLRALWEVQDFKKNVALLPPQKKISVTHI